MALPDAVSVVIELAAALVVASGLWRNFRKLTRVEIFASVTTALIAAAPAAYLLGAGVERRIVAYGFLAWALGVLVKLGLDQALVAPVLHPRLSPAALGVTQGLVSSVTEMGATALVLRFALPHLSLTEAMAFGAGAACETVLLLAVPEPLSGTPFGTHVAGEMAALRKERPGLLFTICVVERTLATVLHIASRVLVYLTLRLGTPLPALAAFLTFAAVDGVAYYGLVRKWRLTEPADLRRLYGWIAAMVAVQVAAVAVFRP